MEYLRTPSSRRCVAESLPRERSETSATTSLSLGGVPYGVDLGIAEIRTQAPQVDNLTLHHELNAPASSDVGREGISHVEGAGGEINRFN